MKPDVPAWRKDLGEQFLMSLRAQIKLRRKLPMAANSPKHHAAAR